MINAIIEIDNIRVKKFSLNKGSYKTFSLWLEESDGRPVDLTDVSAVILKLPADAGGFVELSGTVPTPTGSGKIDFVLVSSDADDLNADERQAVQLNYTEDSKSVVHIFKEILEVVAELS